MFRGHVVRKEALENLILIEQIEGKGDWEKHLTTYLASLSELLVEQVWGTDGKKWKFIKCYKGQVNVENTDRRHPESNRHRERETIKYLDVLPEN